MEDIRAIIARVVREDNPDEVCRYAYILPWREVFHIMASEGARNCLEAVANDAHNVRSAFTNKDRYSQRLTEDDVAEGFLELFAQYPNLSTLLSRNTFRSLCCYENISTFLTTIFVRAFKEGSVQELDRWWVQSMSKDAHILCRVITNLNKGGCAQRITLSNLTISGPEESVNWLHSLLDNLFEDEIGDKVSQTLFDSTLNVMDEDLAKSKQLPKYIEKFPQFIPKRYLQHRLVQDPSTYRLFETNHYSGRVFYGAVKTNNKALILRVIRHQSTRPSKTFSGVFAFVIIDDVLDDNDARLCEDPKFRPDACGFDTSPQAVAYTRALLRALRFGGPSNDTRAAIPVEALPVCIKLLLVRQRLESSSAAAATTIYFPMLPTEIWHIIIHHLYHCPLMTLAEHSVLVQQQLQVVANRVRELQHQMVDTNYNLSLQHLFSSRLPVSDEERQQNKVTRQLVWKWRKQHDALVLEMRRLDSFRTFTRDCRLIFERCNDDIRRVFSGVRAQGPEDSDDGGEEEEQGE